LVRVPGMVPEGQSYLEYFEKLVTAVESALAGARSPTSR
jgi:hypothetical protein